MSGIEVAGLVLGAFPILINCLDHYREGFGSLGEWWNFQNSLKEFIDGIERQMMRYHENMVSLLEPIVSDAERMAALARNISDPRWTDGSLNGALRKRLASEHDRYFRVVERMQELVAYLEKLLGIGDFEDGKMSWTDPSQHNSAQWHFNRLRVSFSKGKHKTISKLAACNDELQEILGYSERIIPIADKHRVSEPLRIFDKLRQHAESVYNTLKDQWRCAQPSHESHKAHLTMRVNEIDVRLTVIFVLEGGQSLACKRQFQNIEILPVSEPETSLRSAGSQDISHVEQSAQFVKVQQAVADRKSKPGLLSSFRSSLRKPSEKGGVPPSNLPQKSVAFQHSLPAITFSRHLDKTEAASEDNEKSFSSPHQAQLDPITDLCSFLATAEPPLGLIQDDCDRHFKFLKSSRGIEELASGVLQLLSLPEVINAHYNGSLKLPRLVRHEMAAHVASALLQAHSSPWLPHGWCKSDFYFLVDTRTQTLSSTHPLVCGSFGPIDSQPPKSDSTSQPNTNPSVEEYQKYNNPGPVPFAHKRQSEGEEARICLFNTGVIILELIFGRSIEDCPFRKDYLGRDDKPNDQTDVCTAKKWQTEVAGESGGAIADAVRRCLDCAFGPMPNFKDARFRESVYVSVIKPLVGLSRIWPEETDY